MKQLSLLLLLFLGASTSIDAQNPLIPGWETGDTLEFFVTESELVESERVSLEAYTVRLYVKDKNPQRSILEGHLFLPTPKNRGPHWDTFFKLLQDVPFTFFLQNGVSNTFQNAVQVEASMQALDKIMLHLVEQENLQPIDYAEIAQWMNQLKPRNELPAVLEGYFQPLNKMFDQYGQVLQPSGQIPFTNLIENCGDSAITIDMLIDGKVKFNGPDTLVMTNQLLVKPENDPAKYQILANCEKLEGLEAVIQIDAYSNVQTEVWEILVNKGKVLSYKYDKVITMQFQELKTTRGRQVRVILM